MSGETTNPGRTVPHTRSASARTQRPQRVDFKVRVFTSDGWPTRSTTSFRINTGGPTFVNPLCSRGSDFATPWADYVPLDESRTVPAGTPNGTEHPFQVLTSEDGQQEPNEQFYMYLNGNNTACVAIIDND